MPKRIKWTNELFIEYVTGRGYTTSSPYLGIDSTVPLVCSNNHIWNTTLYKLRNLGHNCPECVGGISLPKREFLERMSKNPNIIILNEESYSSMSTIMKLRCTVDNYEWECSAGRISRNPKCPCCSGKRRYTTDEVRLILNENGIILQSPSYKNAHQILNIKCSVCDTEWTAPFDRLKISGCPTCSSNSTIHDVIYIWRIKNTDICKIGVTTSHRGKRRICEVARSVGAEYELILYEHLPNPKELERYIKTQYTSNPYETADFNGHTEFRILAETDLQKVIKYIKDE